MANFSDFSLGDNVYELADGLVPEMAEVFEVELGPQPDEQALANLVGAIGSSKVLQENIPQVQEKLGTEQDGFAVAAEWLGRSGIQQALNRSLWTPEITPPDSAATIITGGVANWQDRVASLVADSLSDSVVYLVSGNRVMDTATEKVNSNVEQFFAAEDRYPTEAEYSSEFVAPALLAAGKLIVINEYEMRSGDKIAAHFVEQNQIVFSGNVRFARVANAGIQLAAQFVREARKAGLEFDINPSSPQAYVLTDTFKIARTEEQLKDPKNFQNPYTGIRQIAVTSKELVSIAR